MDLAEARRLAQSELKTPRSDNADRQYRKRARAVLAMLREAGMDASAASVDKLARDAGWSVGTYNQTRTALAYSFALGVIDHARIYNRERRNGRTDEARDARQKAVAGAAALASIRKPPAEKLPRNKRTRSPRRGLHDAQLHAVDRGAPDWRTDLAAAMADEHDRAMVTVMAATGCRPAELVAGVDLERDRNGHITATIAGAKVNADRGQPSRTLTLDPETDTGRALAALIDAAGGEWRCSLSASDKANALRQRVARRAAAVGYLTVSAYSLRHQFASDAKAARLEPREIAAALGHATDKAATAYGRRNQGTGGVKILRVKADHDVRCLGKEKPWKDPSPAAPRP